MGKRRERAVEALDRAQAWWHGWAGQAKLWLRSESGQAENVSQLLWIVVAIVVIGAIVVGVNSFVGGQLGKLSFDPPTPAHT
jgi:hypothetical protein